MTKVIITGAAGFIGSHIAKWYTINKPETELILIDDLSRGKKEYLEQHGVKQKLTVADLRNTDEAFKSFVVSEPDIVYHTACRIGGMQFLHGSPEKEFFGLNDNLAIDRNVFKSCISIRAKKIVYTSSISVYNTSKQYCSNIRFSEDDLNNDALEPEGGYGWAKYIGEKSLNLLSEMGIDVGIARIFKSYGPCDDYSVDSGQVVLSLMRKILEGQNPLKVWGDGRAERCLVYIDDLIDALIKLGEHPNSLTVNLGGTRPISVRELAETTVKISGEDIDIEFGTSDQNGPLSREPILHLAKTYLDYSPKVSLKSGLEKSWEWMKNEFNRT